MDEPAVSKRARNARKSLTKSKLGCRACKTRKVKCDEHRPLCGNCEKRYPGLGVCEWDTLLYQRTSVLPSFNSTLQVSSNAVPLSPLPSNQSTASSNSIPASLPLATPLSSRSLEFRLFHQWTSSTVYTIKAWIIRGPLFGWLDLTPIWASEYDFILEFILGFAALHLYCIDPVANATFQNAVHYYIGNATQMHRKALANVTAENARQLFLAAMWTNLFGKARLQLREPGDSYKLPTEMFHLHRGLVATYDALSSFLSEGELEVIRNVGTEEGLLFHYGVDLNEIGYLTKEQREDVQLVLKHIGDRALKSQKEAEVLKRSLQFMVSIQFGQRVHEPEEWTQRRISMMQAIVPPELLTLLEAEDPLAMAILARYFMLLKDRKEWFHAGLAETQVRGIANMMPAVWKDLMIHPLKVVEDEDKLYAE